MRLKIRTFITLALCCTPVCGQAVKEPEAKPVVAGATKSATPVDRLAEEWWKTRWEAKLAETKDAGRTKLVFLGDSITQAWEAGGKETWTKNYEKYNALNLGFSGDRTEHLLWRLKNGELTKLHPKVAVLLIGTNNTGHEQRPAADTASGIKAILDELHIIWPETKVLVLAVFPRGATSTDPLRKLNDEINTVASKFADNKTVFYLDISSSFLKPDETLPVEVMPDLLHLTPGAYETWAEAMKPKLKELGL